MWKPKISKERPLYRVILSSLHDDIASGKLTGGERLPTHRELARQLGLTIGTITKVFTEAERDGLVVSRVGRGTYVLEFPENIAASDSDSQEVINLSVNTVTIEPFNNALNRVFGALSRRKSLHGLLEYHPVPGLHRHRLAGTQWMKLRGITADPEHVIVCNGAQEALMATLATVTRPGGTILTESLNYAGLRRLTELFRLDIRGIPCDQHGMRPDRLKDAAKGAKVSAILCSPTLHNPTNTTMPLSRRKEILRIATKLGAVIIENDSYGHISDSTIPTISALDRERSIYICSTTKSIAPGLRIGFLSGPPGMMPSLSSGVHGTSWTSPSLMGEVATMLIESGMAQNFLVWHRKEAAERTKLAREILKNVEIGNDAPTYHIWMDLPAPWRANEFVTEVRSRGALISPADHFAVDRNPTPHSVRISLGCVASRSRLAEGLKIVASALEARPPHTRSVV